MHWCVGVRGELLHMNFVCEIVQCESIVMQRGSQAQLY